MILTRIALLSFFLLLAPDVEGGTLRSSVKPSSTVVDDPRWPSEGDSKPIPVDVWAQRRLQRGPPGGGGGGTTCSSNLAPGFGQASSGDCMEYMEFEEFYAYPEDFTILNQVAMYKCPDSGLRVFVSNGIPDHGITVGMNEPCVQNYMTSVPLYPSFGGTNLEPGALGIIGMSLNGVPLYGAQEGGGANAVEPIADGVLVMGVPAFGHAARQGNWHYHSGEVGRVSRVEDLTSDTLLGYAMDGFPIYGPIDDPSILDECNGIGSDPSTYRYHVRIYDDIDETVGYCDGTSPAIKWPYILGCFKGDVTLASLQDSTEVAIPDDCVYLDGPQMNGDPHIHTWGGKWFDYNGECDLVLISAPEFHHGLGLKLHVRTTIQYDYSYIEAAAIQIGSDVLEVGSYGDYWVNGVQSAAGLDKGKTITLGGSFSVKYIQPEARKHFFPVELGNNNTLHINVWKQIVSVKLDHNHDSQFSGATGIMGHYDLGGHMVGRDGVTVMKDPNEFGQEWQVRPGDYDDDVDQQSLFVTQREPQYPKQCKLPSPSTTMDNVNVVGGRRLQGDISTSSGVTPEQADKACAKWKKNSTDHTNCMMDVLKTGDLEMAEAEF